MQRTTIAHLVSLFDGGLYTADIAGRPKPDPAVYLMAAGSVVLGFTGGPHSPPDQAARLREAGAYRPIPFRLPGDTLVSKLCSPARYDPASRVSFVRYRTANCAGDFYH